MYLPLSRLYQGSMCGRKNLIKSGFVLALNLEGLIWTYSLPETKIFRAFENILATNLCQDPDCDVSFKPLGCFRDKRHQRALPHYIYNERDETIANYGGQKVDWTDWENYLPEFICRCGRKAKELGFDLFAVQFYGKNVYYINCNVLYWGFPKPRKITTKKKCMMILLVKSLMVARFLINHPSISKGRNEN